MSRPESTGESLEAILASIRESLSEQSTDVLEEEAATPAEDGDGAGTPEPGRDGLARRLAEAAAEAPQVDEAVAGEPDIPSPVEPTSVEPASVEHTSVEHTPVEGAPASAPLPEAAPAAPRSEKDPLWFLGGLGQSAAKQGDPAAARRVGTNGKAPPGEPKASPSGVVRGPLPPFFGSKAETQKAEVVLAQPASSAAGVMPPPVAQPATPPYGQSSMPAAAAEMPPAPVGVVAQAADGLRNGRTGSLFGHAPGGDTPHIHALEAAVLELLRPMLRQWLDENMPRLVSAALRDQAVGMAERDAKKP